MSGHHHHESSGAIGVAFLLNLSFTLLEIVGGVLTNSMAILSDALHDLGDSLSLGIAWYLERYAKKGPDVKFSFGYARFSLLGALINSVILITGSLFILYKAAFRILSPESVHPKGMMLLAIIGIAVNGLAVLKLKTGNSLNEKVVSWHLLEDVLGWAVVLVASIVLLFVDLPVIDPLLSVGITLYVLWNVYKNLKEILTVLLQGVPQNLSIEQMERLMLDKTEILDVYHTHIWSLEGEKHFISTHVVVADGSTRDDIVALKEALRQLMHANGIEHVTLEVEFECERKGGRFFCARIT